MKQQLIGFYSSSPQSGKTTAANILKSKGFHIVSFADPLKSMAYSLLIDLGYNSSQAFDFLYSNKNEVIDRIGVTGRYLMRTLGTEWGRDMIDTDIWTTAWKQRSSGFNRVVVDDVRRANEATAILDRGGQLWKIVRHVENPDTNHASEGGLDDWDGFDLVIANNGTPQEFRTAIISAYVDNILLKEEAAA